MVQHANFLFLALMFGFIGILCLGASVALGSVTLMVSAVILLAVAVISVRRFDHLTN